MERTERFQDYMLGFSVGLGGHHDRETEVISREAWVAGFKAGRNARETAERDAARKLVGVPTILVDRQDVLA